MSKLAFVTGSSGFIGTYCVQELRRHNYRVVGLDIHNNTTTSDISCTDVYCGPVNKESLDRLANMHGVPDALFNCAGSGSVPMSMTNPDLDFNSNVTSAMEVLDFSRRNKSLPKIVLISSAAVYGNIKQMPLNEHLSGTPVSPYGFHKKIMEELAFSYKKNFNVPSICVRPFSVYGNGLKKQLLWDACNKAANNEFSFFGTGEELRDWLHVEDLARLLYLACQHASSEHCIINGGTGQGTSIKQILTVLGECWQPQLSPLFTSQNRQGDPTNLVADVKLANSLGFKPTIDFQQGIKKYVDWFINSGVLC